MSLLIMKINEPLFHTNSSIILTINNLIKQPANKKKIKKDNNTIFAHNENQLTALSYKSFNNFSNLFNLVK